LRNAQRLQLRNVFFGKHDDVVKMKIHRQNLDANL
jgi:hypothetical protein